MAQVEGMRVFLISIFFLTWGYIDAIFKITGARVAYTRPRTFQILSVLITFFIF